MIIPQIENPQNPWCPSPQIQKFARKKALFLIQFRIGLPLIFRIKVRKFANLLFSEHISTAQLWLKATWKAKIRRREACKKVLRR
jgi:hypothetical protein